VTADTEDEGQEQTLLSGLLNAADLDKMSFDPLTEHVPNLVVEGFGVLAGPPKVGKSWLVDNIAAGCAYGGTVLDAIPVTGRPVLLASLEDSPRRLQSRLRKITHGQPLPERLDIITEIKPGLVVATIAEWLLRHEESAPLCVLDTLGKARQQRRPGDDPYIADYQLGTQIKRVIDAIPGAAILCVHHTRKMGADDFVDTVSGTAGIAGSADYILVLSRKRKSEEGILAVTGRDIEENEYAVKTENGLWKLDGMDITDAAATVDTRRDQTAEAKLGTKSLDAMKFVNAREKTSPAELAEHLSIDGQEAGRQLKRLYDGGYIDKDGRGTYVPLGGKTGKSGKTADQHPSGNLPLSPDLPPPNNVRRLFGDDDAS
jgi:RecA-family ATPase